MLIIYVLASETNGAGSSATIYRITVNPKNRNILYVVGSSGTLRTVNLTQSNYVTTVLTLSAVPLNDVIADSTATYLYVTSYVVSLVCNIIYRININTWTSASFAGSGIFWNFVILCFKLYIVSCSTSYTDGTLTNAGFYKPVRLKIHSRLKIIIFVYLLVWNHYWYI